jgi:hypothetical protein
MYFAPSCLNLIIAFGTLFQLKIRTDAPQTEQVKRGAMSESRRSPPTPVGDKRG